MNKNFKVSGSNYNDINEGIEYEFILKDINVLDQEDNELDQIENVILKEFNKRNKIINAKEGMSSFEKDKEILPQYGEDKEIGFFIKDNDDNDNEFADHNQDLNENKQKEELNKIKEKFKLLKSKKNDNLNNNAQKTYSKSLINQYNQNLTSDLKIEKKFTSDYMTSEEFKNKEFKKIKIQPKKRTKMNLLDDEEIKSEVDKSSEIKQISQNLPNTKVYDEYHELNFYLEKQRNLIPKEKKKTDPEDVVKRLMTETKNENIVQDNVDEENGTEFISDTTEFLKKVATKKEIEENYKMITSQTHFSLRDTKGGSHSVVNIPFPTDRLKYGASSLMSNYRENEFLGKKRKQSMEEKEINEENIENDIKSQADTQLEEGETKLEIAPEIIDEPLVGKGIGVALQVLRKRGLVGKKEMWGRFKDKTYTSNDSFMKKDESKPVEVKPNYFKKEGYKEIELDYRDEKGRTLTPKEMYRYQSYIFHGKGPSKNKIEKRLVRQQLEDKIKNQDVSQRSKTFQYLKKMQNKMNTPFVVLQGKNTSLP